MKKFIWAAVLCASAAGFTACNTAENSSGKSDSTTAMQDTSSANATELKPTGPKPEWAPDIDNEMAVVIEKLASLGGKPIETLSAPEARQQPSAADATMAVMKEHNIPMPVPMCDTMGKEIPVSGGSIHARIYTPKNGNGPFPVIVYYHGGGFVIATVDTYNASATALSDQVGAVVVSVEYRKGPENKFPTAHNDAFDAYKWVVKNAGSIKGDPNKIAVVGESAGGNLAANVSIMARDNGIMVPIHQVLVYPIAQSDMKTESYTRYANAKPLNKPMMEWFTKNYLPDMATAADTRISLVKANLKGLPSTTIITAQIDPLHDDGMMLADKLKEANVNVDFKNYDGVTHEFFGMAAVVPDAKDAQAYAAKNLKNALQ